MCEGRGEGRGGPLPHVGHTAHVPRADVTVEDLGRIEHIPVRAHAAEACTDRGSGAQWKGKRSENSVR